MNLRRLSIYDYDQLITLWEKAGLLYRPRGRDSRESIAQQMTNDQVAFLGIEVYEKLAGAVVVSDDGRKGWINRLAVDPEYRRQGLALRLIAAAEEELQRRGLGIYAALIEGENEPSLKLFVKAGYSLRRDIVYLRKSRNDEV